MSQYKKVIKRFRRVDVQVACITAFMVVLSCFAIYLYGYNITYQDMLKSLENRVYSIYNYIENDMDKSTFFDINSKDDIDKVSYIETCSMFEQLRRATGVQYLYTAKRSNDGKLIYIIDGIELTAPDIRYPGDEIEPEIQGHLNRALAGENILPKEITHTDWGDIFITYLPIHDNDDPTNIIGVIGIEFEAAEQYTTYNNLKRIAPAIILGSCLLSAIIAYVVFRRISNPSYQDFANTDMLTKLKNRNAYLVDTKNMCAIGAARESCIMLADLNGLKSANDTYGHEAGDLYIKCMANALKAACAGGEIVYRVGGDEFVVIIRSSNSKMIATYKDSLKSEFKKATEKCSFSASYAIGHAIVDGNGDDAFEIAYTQADDEMYKDKKKFYERQIK